MGNGSKHFLGCCLVLAALSAGATDTVSGEPDNRHVDRSRYLEAAAAAQRGDYVIAYCIWHPLAEQGDPQAQYALGWMYHNGYGLVSDDRAAKAWWEMAIAQGDTNAMFSLGALYSVGSETIERDYPAALRLWLQAAAAGDENARFALHELLQRNLPELASLTRSLRAQYPQLLGLRMSDQHKGARGRPRHPVTDDKMPGALAISQPNPLDGFTYTGELVALATGYRPEYGWAAVQLFREGKQLIAELH